MMEQESEEKAGGLLSRTADRLQTEKGKELFPALVAALERGGPKAVKELMSTLLGQERELREVDAEEGDAHGQ